MSDSSELPTENESSQVHSTAGPAWLVGLAVVAFAFLGFLGFILFKPRLSPPPAEIAADPLLVEGRAVYLIRCASCHGETGKGDGPSARLLREGRAGDFTASSWKHGDRPEQVLAVIRQGTPNGQMSAWGRVLSPQEIRAVAAFVYHLAHRPVPESLRNEN
jgi:cytochrome c oxidase cbb3-type subunit 3